MSLTESSGARSCHTCVTTKRDRLVLKRCVPLSSIHSLHRHKQALIDTQHTHAAPNTSNAPSVCLSPVRSSVLSSASAQKRGPNGNDHSPAGRVCAVKKGWREAKATCRDCSSMHVLAKNMAIDEADPQVCRGTTHTQRPNTSTDIHTHRHTHTHHMATDQADPQISGGTTRSAL